MQKAFLRAEECFSIEMALKLFPPFREGYDIAVPLSMHG